MFWECVIVNDLICGTIGLKYYSLLICFKKTYLLQMQIHIFKFRILFTLVCWLKEKNNIIGKMYFMPHFELDLKNFAKPTNISKKMIDISWIT